MLNDNNSKNNTVPTLNKFLPLIVSSYYIKTKNLKMQFQCPHCERTFSRRAALRNHVKTHESRIDKILEEIQEESIQQEREILNFEQNPVYYEEDEELVNPDEELFNVEREEEFVSPNRELTNIEEKEDVEEEEEEEEEEEKDLFNIKEGSEEEKEERSEEEKEERSEDESEEVKEALIDEDAQVKSTFK